MKFAATLLMVIAFALTGCNKGEKAEFWVRGNCDMCKENIENAISSVDGVNSVSWSEENSIATVWFDPEKRNDNAWHEACAKAGYDTKMKQADPAAYANLKECCKKPEDQKQ